MISYNVYKIARVLLLCASLPTMAYLARWEMRYQQHAQDELEAYHNAEISLKVIEMRGNVHCTEE